MCYFVEREKEKSLLRYLVYPLDIYRSTLPINKLVTGIVSVQVIDGPSTVPARPLRWALAGWSDWMWCGGWLHGWHGWDAGCCGDVGSRQPGRSGASTPESRGPPWEHAVGALGTPGSNVEQIQEHERCSLLLTSEPAFTSIRSSSILMWTSRSCALGVLTCCMCHTLDKIDHVQWWKFLSFVVRF